MKTKRLLSFILASLMIVSAVFMTSCDEKDELDEDLSSKKTVTLNMYIITEDETTDEAAKAVQLAINDLTLSKYKTKIKINYLKEEDYWDAVEAEKAAILKALEAPAPVVEELPLEQEDAEDAENAEDAEDEELTDEEEIDNLDAEYDELYKVGDIIIEEPQLDIFLINSYDKYIELVENGDLAPLDTYLTLESKILTSYIFPAYLEAAKINGVTYGIPVNGPIGTCEYILFNKELLDKYGFEAESMTDLVSLEKYLEVIKKNEPDVIPLGSTSTHKGYDAYGSVYGAAGIVETGTPLVSEEILSIYDQADVKEHYRKINEYEKKGYLVTDEEAKAGKKVAVEFKKGSSASIPVWEAEAGCEYEYSIYRAPVATNDDLLGSVFAISAYSLNKERSMEIIKLINTNPVLANLLQWGVEGVNYEYIKETKTINLLSNNYRMNNRYTGNEYIKYRLSTEPDTFEASKAQNLGVKLSSFYGYSFKFDGKVEGEKNDEDAEKVLVNAAEIAEVAVEDLLTGKGDFDEKYSAFLKKVNSAYRGRVYDVALEVKLAMKPYFVEATDKIVDELAGVATLTEFKSALAEKLLELHGTPGFDEEELEKIFTKTLNEYFTTDHARFITNVKTALARLTDTFIDNFSKTLDRTYYIDATNEIIDEIVEQHEEEEVVSITKTEFINTVKERVAPIYDYYWTEELIAEIDPLLPGYVAPEEVTEEATEEATEEVVEEVVEEATEEVAEEATETAEAVEEVDSELIEDIDDFAQELKDAFVEATRGIAYDYTLESVVPLITKKATETFPENVQEILDTINTNLTAGGIDVFRINFMLAQYSGFAKAKNEKTLASLKPEELAALNAEAEGTSEEDTEESAEGVTEEATEEATEETTEEATEETTEESTEE